MPDHPSDSQLLERVRASDEEAFRLLFERYQPIVFRQALLEVRDTDLAHDIVQETFLRIWDRRSSLRTGHSVLGFALRIAHNLVRDAARHHEVRSRLAGDIPPPARPDSHDPSEALQAAMLHERILTVINEDLPERCREVFLLSRFEERDHDEIATLLGISPKTVANQIHLALSILRKRLRDYTLPHDRQS